MNSDCVVVDWMQLVAFGIYEQAVRPWYLMVMLKPYSPLTSHPTGWYQNYNVWAVVDSLNRYQIATGSGDDTIRIWDMRKIKALHTIPAHKSNISDIRFFRGSGQSSSAVQNAMKMELEDEDVKPVLPDFPKPPESGMQEDVKPALNAAQGTFNASDEKFTPGLYFVSSGYDGLIKVWSADDWHLIKAMSTDAGKVMSVDITADGSFIASGSWNRSYQLFAGENIVA